MDIIVAEMLRLLDPVLFLIHFLVLFDSDGQDQVPLLRLQEDDQHGPGLNVDLRVGLIRWGGVGKWTLP